MQEQINGFRLSPQQKRLWLLSQGDQSSDCAQSAILIEGDLDIELLRRAVGLVVDRHEILRTTFRSQTAAGVPIQVIDRSGPVEWREAVISNGCGDRLSLEVEKLFRDERERPFDFENGPLLRLTIVTINQGRRMLLVSLPSLCADARTLKNLYLEISRVYGGDVESRGEQSEPAQYLQFSEWRHDLLESEEAEEGRAFWLRQRRVNGSPALPFESQCPESMRRDVVDLEIDLEAELIAQIEAAAGRRHTSLAVWMLACWQTLLWRLTGQPDIAVECLFEGRRYDELRDALGLFASFIPLHCRLSPGLKFEDVLKQVKQIFEECETWQEFWTPDVAGEGESSNGDRVSFEFIDWGENVTAGGVPFSVYRQEVSLNRFHLKLSCRLRGGRLLASLLFDPARISAADSRRLAAQYRKLLKSAAVHPESEVELLELIDDLEREQLLVAWNDTRREFPEAACLHQLFERQVERTPDAIAVVHGAQRVSFRELNTWANQLARYLRGLGVGPESRVGLCVERSVEMLVGVLGVLKANGVYAPLDTQLPRERLSFMIEDAGLSILLTKQEWRQSLSGADSRLVFLDVDRSEISRESGHNLPNLADPQNLAYVIYTSGSTGTPKGVMITHRGLVNYLDWSAAAYCVEPAHGSPVHSSLGFDLTVTSLFIPLLTGQTAFLIPETEGVEGLGSLLADGRCLSLVKLTPSHLELLSRLLPAENAAAQTRTLVVGGEALWSGSLSFWRRHAPQTRVINEYGPTETVVGCCIYEIAAGEIRDGAMPIGRPIANTRLYALDPGMRLVPIGMAGELYIAGAGVARGYVNRPEMTAERFAPDPYGSEIGARMYRSGDLARYLSDGNLIYLGRADQQVKIHGYRIELGEVESALAKHEAISECAVVARENSAGEKQLIAYVVSQGHRGIVVSDLVRFLAERLPPYMVPASFVSIDALPLTTNGKLDQSSLPAPEFSRDRLKEEYQAPRNLIEEVLAGIWSQALGVDQVGVDDNFFALGGDSMRSIQVTGQVKERGWNISPQDLFRYQTVGEMAAYLQNGRSGVSLWRRTQPFELVSEEDRRRLPAEIEDAYPLGQVQAGMLYHTGLTPDAPVYHNVCSYRIRARLDPDALRKSVQRVIERHPLLRTSFDLTSYSEPLQLVHKTARMEVPVVDLRHLSNDEQERVLAEFVRVEWKRLFDLKTPPLLRTHIHLRSDQTFQVTITDSHALIDGWSLTSTFAEIFSLHFALLDTGILPNEPPPPVSYRDFIAMEREALASEDCRRYWLSKVEGCAPLRLPRLAPAGRRPGRDRVRVHPVSISVETGEKLRRLARSLAVPLKSVLLAAHLRVLSLITGRTEFLAGVGANGRPEELGGEQVRGLFLNVLPFRFRLPHGDWKDLVLKTIETEMEMLPYRRYPLSALQRRFGSQPLLETDFEYLHFHSVEKLLRNNEIEFLENRDISETNFTVATIFQADPLTSQLTLKLHCDTTELSDDQIETFGQYYARALTVMADDPDSDLDSVRLLSAEEGRQLLVEWNDPGRESAPAAPVHHLFAAQARRAPDRLAIDSLSGQISYRELDQWATQLADDLRGLGVGPESRVGVMMERSPELVASLLGVLKAGGAYVPLEPKHPAERLKTIAEDSGLGIVLTQERWREQAQRTGARIIICEKRAEAGIRAGARIEDGVEAENLAYIIYTSGSTGVPKGVQISHGALASYLHWMGKTLPLTDAERILQLTSFGFDASVWELYAPLIAGARLTLPAQEIQDGADLVDTIREYEITTLQLVPSLLRVLLEAETVEDCHSLQRVFSCGEALPVAVRENFFKLLDAELYNFYGPTEATVEVSFFHCRPGTVENLVPIGRTAANAGIYLLDDYQRLAPVGAPGEIYISGPQLARGYLGSPELTAERFIPDLVSGQAGTRLYRTGDLARYWPDGRIEFLGRADHQVKVRGFRIELGEIEAALRRHEAIEAVAVKDHSSLEDRSLVAYVVMRPARELTSAQLRDFVKERLPEYMAPSIFVKLDELPLTPNGKVDREALPSPDQSRLGPGNGYVGPRSVAELKLADIWEKLLNRPRIGVKDDFFDLGGHSLLAVRMFSLVEKEFGRRVRMASFLQRPTIERLAGVLKREGVETESTIVEIQSGGRKTPLFFVHPAGGTVFCYLDLARLIDPERPFYGLQESWQAGGRAGELDENHPRHSGIEGMAARYIEAMREVQPEGPYALGGWSMGGLIAFEMARQLKAQAQEIRLLALVDTAVPARNGRSLKTDAAAILFRLAADLGASLKNKPRSRGRSLQGSLDQTLTEILEHAIRSGFIPEETGPAYLQRLFNLYQRHLQAAQTYAPQPFAGRLILFNASGESEPATLDQDHGWNQVALHGVQVFNLPCAHHTILKQPYVQTLAQHLHACLSAALPD
jgi:amino acid adenylation domain-containing protein